jgi:hypothetical protein
MLRLSYQRVNVFSGIRDNSLRNFTSVVSGKGEWRERHLLDNVSLK